MKLSGEIQQRIAMLRFFMIFGIVILHTPPYIPLREVGSEPFDIVKAFFQSALFRTTVPILTTISGFLLFSANQDKDFGALLKKKFKTLVVPFLVFNLTLLCAAYLAGKYAGLMLSYDLAGGDSMTWLNAAFGVNGAPINYPLNFLRDLIVIMLLVPLFSLCLRNKPFAGLAVVFAIFMLNLDGPLVLRNTMPVMFYLGGMAAICRWRLKALDRYALPCMSLFLAACGSAIAFRITDLTYLRFTSVFLLWPFTAVLYETAIGKWLASKSKYSFFIFVAHAPLLAVSWMVYRKYSSLIPYQLYWLLAPFVISGLLILFHKVAMRLFPGFFSFIIASKPVKKEKKVAPFCPSPAGPEQRSWTVRSEIGPAD